MVYYGTLSRGCERCRQRKIRCDERKPDCRNCAKHGTQCPGYRNLLDLHFRNRLAQICTGSSEDCRPSSSAPDGACRAPTSFLFVQKLNASRLLAPTLPQSGADFFFAKYTYSEPPFSRDFWGWIFDLYHSPNSSDALRGSIEAVGLAGLSNVTKAPDLRIAASRQYCSALANVQRLLDDLVLAQEDETLMCVILLGLFETVNSGSLKAFPEWNAHVEGATTLLNVRGSSQLANERGVLLFLLIRSQVLVSCLQQQIPVPRTLVEMTLAFMNSGIRQRWQQNSVASPGSMSEISLRIVDFYGDFHNGKMTSTKAVYDTAYQIDADLQAWYQRRPTSWMYHEIGYPEATAGIDGLGPAVPIYPSRWVAEAWNNWRVLRILIHQIILENDQRSKADTSIEQEYSLSLIRELSMDVCRSTVAFVGSPRMISLIRPLYVVCQEERNSSQLRSLAVAELLRIEADLGVRQAGLLARTVSGNVGVDGEDEREPALSSYPYTFPLVPIG